MIVRKIQITWLVPSVSPCIFRWFPSNPKLLTLILKNIIKDLLKQFSNFRISESWSAVFLWYTLQK